MHVCTHARRHASDVVVGEALGRDSLLGRMLQGRGAG